MSVNTATTPIETKKPLVKDAEDADLDIHLYRSMIGSLMYFTASRPDIMYAVCACSRESAFDLEAYSDSDYAGANLNRKSTTRGNFNKLDDLVGEGVDYVVNEGRSTDKIIVKNTEAEGVSATGEALSTATLVVSNVSCSLRNMVIEIVVLNILSDVVPITTNNV
nr:hypothetical protein [Tanacetum cinerariifolium]